MTNMDVLARPAARAVVLAAGRGTRMQRAGGGVALDDEQRRHAEKGSKALIPFYGHPYLSYVLTALAHGGITHVCVVVPEGDDSIPQYYANVPLRRLQLVFVRQQDPRGSADALLAAERATGGEPFVLVNGDNVYPASVVDRVRRLPNSGLAGFAQSSLIEGGIPAERIAAYALLELDAAGCLARIIEKPGAELVHSLGPDILVSMTCWRFEASIFDACRSISPSARGEYEIPDAVMFAVSRGVCFDVASVREPVLDLTSRQDVPTVAARLRGVDVLL